MKIENIIKNPTLYYKLDPGERGLAAPTPASHSIMAVASHELSNLHQFEAESASKCGYIIQSGIHLNISKQGSFFAATSGYSEATIVYPHGG